MDKIKSFLNNNWFVSLAVSFTFWFFQSKIDQTISEINELSNSIKRIEASTSFINQSLGKSIDGGQIITAGVNKVSLKENIAIVFKNNPLNLRAGDIIYLHNQSDNTFQATARFVIQKEIETPDNTTKAQIFISDDAAKRLGIENYKAIGIFQLRLLRDDTKKNRHGKQPQGNQNHML